MTLSCQSERRIITNYNLSEIIKMLWIIYCVELPQIDNLILMKAPEPFYHDKSGFL